MNGWPVPQVAHKRNLYISRTTLLYGNCLVLSQSVFPASPYGPRPRARRCARAGAVWMPTHNRARQLRECELDWSSRVLQSASVRRPLTSRRAERHGELQVSPSRRRRLDIGAVQGLQRRAAETRATCQRALEGCNVESAEMSTAGSWSDFTDGLTMAPVVSGLLWSTKVGSLTAKIVAKCGQRSSDRCVCRNCQHWVGV
jgi:hypothetical protein